LETVKTIEREHLVPIALGGADDPTNCAYSLGAAHKIQTNGNGATSYGSDKHLIAKLNPKRIAKFVVRKNSDCSSHEKSRPKRKWGSKKFTTRKSPWGKRTLKSKSRLTRATHG